MRRPVLDTQRRPLRTLRLSVTDRCNLRCHYCMPEDVYAWLPREDLLTFEEIGRIVDRLGDAGVERVRLTGGEPLIRRRIDTLVATLARRTWLDELTLTTNGVLLADAAAGLQRAGLDRVTVSLDTLRADRFMRLARLDALADVLAGVDAARRVGFPVKLDTVVTRGDNDDEMIDLLDYARVTGAEVRFIEYMDVGGATRWRPEAVVTRDEMLARIADRRGPAEALTADDPAAPAARFRLPDGQTFGIIASTSRPFCQDCDRARLTADGVLLLCLYAQHGTDLRRPLRAGASDETLDRVIRAVWESRADRGAEERLHVHDRAAYIPIGRLRHDAHLEMHTRGG